METEICLPENPQGTVTWDWQWESLGVTVESYKSNYLLAFKDCLSLEDRSRKFRVAAPLLLGCVSLLGLGRSSFSLLPCEKVSSQMNACQCGPQLPLLLLNELIRPQSALWCCDRALLLCICAGSDHTPTSSQVQDLLSLKALFTEDKPSVCSARVQIHHSDSNDSWESVAHFNFVLNKITDFNRHKSRENWIAGNQYFEAQRKQMDKRENREAKNGKPRDDYRKPNLVSNLIWFS